MSWKFPKDAPLLICLAGSNGAGKSTFYEAHLKPSGLPFVNADVLAREFELRPYEAASLATEIRTALFAQRRSFLFETVFSDPADDKVNFLLAAADAGYTVELLFIGISSPEVSVNRIAQRVIEGGHDVPREKIASRFSRTLKNLQTAMAKLPSVHVLDNDDLTAPYRLVAVTRSGKLLETHPPVPAWLAPLLPKQ